MGIPLTELNDNWEQKVYTFSVTLPAPPLPEPSSDWGDSGVNLGMTCPGAQYCGNPDAEANCRIEMKKPLKTPQYQVVSPFDPNATMKLPPMQFRVVFPPKVILAGLCPHYPEKEAPPA